MCKIEFLNFPNDDIRGVDDWEELKILAGFFF